MPVSEQKTFWTQDRIATLTDLWAMGKSAGVIFHEMKAPSRSAVIGKVHRLKLPARNTRSGEHRIAQPRKPRQSKRFVFGLNFSPIVLDALPLPEPELKELEIPLEQRKSIIELTEHTCRFPIGDPLEPGFFFCGAEPEAEHPYCEYHKRRSVDAVNTRRSSRLRLERLAQFQGLR